MGQIVKLRRSSISGQKPTNSNLQLGEIALNTTDGKAFMAVSGSLGESVQEFITTNTNNTGSINLVGNITASNVSSSFNGPLFTNYVDFNTSYTTSSVPGRFTWNPDEHTLNMGMGIGTATLQMGEELYYPLVINQTLETIYNGTVVMVDPSDPGQGDRVKIVKGDASGTYSSKLFLGILTEDITPGNLGLVTWFGKVRDLNVPSLESYGIKQVSDTWFEGALLYADPNHPGGLTTVEPIAPNLKIRLALVTRLNGNQVTIMVRPTLSPNLEEINNVRPDNVTHGDLLMRSGSVWENTKNLYGEYQITGSLGISGSQELRGDQIISGSVYITKDLVVLGTSSMQNVSASSVDIGTNIINLNTFAPGIRYGGVNVFDSGSSGLSGSLLWDSVTDNWIVIHQLSGGTVNSANLIYGPLSTGGLGTEVNLIENYITKVESGNHGHHITTSSIYDNGSKVAINSNTEITGSLTVTGGINGEINFDFITNTPTLVSGSSQVSYTGLSNIPVGIISGAAQLPAGTVSGSSQVSYTGLSNIPAGIISGAAQLPAGTVSGSSQVSYTGITDKPTLVSGSSQVSYTGLSSIPAGIISGAAQLPAGTVSGSSQVKSLLPTGTVSGSSQVSFTGITDKPTLVSGSSQVSYTGLSNIPVGIISGAAQLPAGTVSGSSQVSYTGITDKPTLVSGSSQVSFTGITDKPTLVSGSAQVDITQTTGYSTFSSSIASTDSTQNGRLSSIEGKTGSISDLNTYTGSNNTVIGTLQTATSSLNSFTSSIHGAIEVTGSNLTVKGDFLVKGTTTIIDSTTLDIKDNIIQLNGTGATNGGLVVRDATAPNTVSGSLLWDTTNDKWIAGQVGFEDEIVLLTKTQALTNKTINGTLNTLSNIPNTSLTNSSISINGNSISLGGTITSATILSSTGVWSGSAQMPSGIVSGSVQVKSLLPAGTVSGSSQVSYTGLSSIPAGIVSGSSQVSYTGLSNIPTGIISGAAQLPAGTVSGSSQVSFTGLSSIPAGIVSGSSQVKSLLPAGTVSGSSQVSFTGLTDKPTLVSGSSQVSYTGLSSIPAGIVSGSSQVSFTGLSNIPAGIISGAEQLSVPAGTVSGSSQVKSLLPTGTVSGSSQISFNGITDKPTLVSGSSQVSFTGITDKPTLVSGSSQVSFTGLSNIPTGIISGAAQLPAGTVSGSSQVSYTGLSNIPTGIVSGSSQVSFTGITDKPTLVSGSSQVKSLLPAGTVSGSSQVSYTGLSNIPVGIISGAAQLPAGTVSGSSQVSYTGITDKPTLVSGSSQVNITQTTGYSAFSSSISSSIGGLSSSIASTDSTQNGRLSSIEGKTGSISDLNTYTGSNNTVIGTLQTATSSLNTFTSSIQGAVEVTGSNLTVKGDFLVKGITTFVDTNVVNINDNIIQLNGTGATNGGMVVRDATAPNTVSGSLLWDTTNDKWIAGQVGFEDEIVLLTKTQALTNKTINGTLNTLSNIPNTSLTNSSITIAGNSISLGGAITSATILSSTGVWSGSAQMPSGIVSGSVQVKSLLPAGTVSGSSQVSYTGLSSIPAGIVSGSSQVKSLLPAGTVSGSSQVSYTGLSSIPAGIVSGSSQVSFTGLSNIPVGIISGAAQLPAGTVSGSSQVSFTGLTDKPTLVSGSSQVSYTGLSSIPAGIVSGSVQVKSLLPAGTVSGSSQVSYTGLSNIPTGIISGAAQLPAGIVSGSSQVSFTGITDKPTLVSGSVQVNITETTGYSTFSSSIASTDSTQNGRLSSIEGKTGSIANLNTYTGSNNTVIGTLQTATSSLNTFTSSLLNAVELTGSNLTVKGDFLVKGITTFVDTNVVNINDNIIQLNGTGATNGGMVVRDATAPNTVSGSLLWDTTNDKWIAGQSGFEDEIVLLTKNQTLTNKTINATLNTLSNIPNASLTNSSISINGNNISLGGSITSATILTSTGVWSGSAQLPTGIVSGAAQVKTLLPAGSVSGSSQISFTGITDKPALVSGSSQVSYSGLSGIPSGIVSGAAQLPAGIVSGAAQLPAGLVSGSSQVSYSGLSGIPTGIISGSAQVKTLLPVGSVSGSGQISFTGITDKPALVSGSSQVSYTGLSGIPTGIISGAAQLPTGLVSGSSQVLNGTTIHSGSFFNGISVVSGSGQISYTGITDKPSTFTPSAHNHSWANITSGIPAGLVSGSSQVSYSGLSGIPSTFTPSSHSHVINEITNLEGSLNEKAVGEHGLYYVIGNTTGTAGTWTGSHSKVLSYYQGLTISYKIGVVGAATTTLNINSLGAVVVKRNTGNLTTHMPVGTTIILVYDGTNFVWADYDSDSVEDYNMRWENNVIAGVEVTRYKILMEGVDGKFYPLSIGDTTGATKTVSTEEYKIGGLMLYYGATTIINAGSTLTNVYTSEYTTYISYTFNQSSGFLAYLPVYLVGTVNTNGSFILDNSTLTSWITQTLPTTENNKVYIHLGFMNNTTTAFRITISHPIYEYKNGKIRLYETNDPRPSSDVYAWAKSSTKPTYTYSEVGGAASSHTHSWANITSGIPAGLVSGSSQVTYSGLSGVPAGIVSGAAQLPAGLVSGSSQVKSLLPAGTVSGSSQVSYTGLSNIPVGIISGAAQLPAGTVSGSSQVSFTGLTDKPALVSGSVQVDITQTTGYSTFSSSIASIDSAQNGRLSSIEGKTGSISNLNVYTGSNNTVIGTLQTATSSLNTFTSSIQGAVEVTGSNLTVKGNFLVKGTTTIIDSTTLDIKDNIVQLNGTGATNGGLVVRDATAPNTVSGSLLWDTTNDKWIAGQVGFEDEVVLLTKTQGITNKTINATLNTLSNIPNTSLTNSSITIAGNSISLGGSITSATILSSTGVWSGSAQLPTGTVSGSVQVKALLPTGTVSGSSQVSYTGLSSIPAGIVSGSSQISYTGLSNIPVGIVSGAAQLPAGLVSGSSQITYSGLSGIPSTFTPSTHNHSWANITSGIPAGLVSGSSQVSFTGITDKPTLVSGSSQITYSGLTGIPSTFTPSTHNHSWANITSGIPAGLVSGSSQVTYSGLSGIPSTFTPSAHTHNYAGSASVGGAASSVASSLILKFDTGTTEGTNLYTFNGSAAKTIDFKAGSNVTLTKAAGVITISSTDTNTTYSVATTSVNGLMSSTDKTKLDGIATGANNYSLPLAASGTRGGIQIGYTATGANIPLQLSSEMGYIALTKSAIESVLTGAITSHTHLYAGSSAAGGAANSVANSLILKFDTGAVEGTSLYTFNGSTAKTLDIKAGSNVTLTKAAGVITIAATDTNTTYSVATTSVSGLMSSTDKTKLDGIATGANNYSLPLAASGTRGGIQIGYSASGGNLPLELLSEKGYVSLTKSAIESVLTGDITSHTHDARYYTESEINSLFLDYITSSNSVTTLASLPITKRSVIASVTGATTLSLAATLPEGRFLTIKVYNTSGSSITQPLPTTSPFESKKTDGTDISSISIAAGGSAEISIWSLNSKYVIKTDG